MTFEERSGQSLGGLHSGVVRREAVLGFFLVRVKDQEEACAIAAESPHTEIGGTTEVRMLGTFPKS